MHKILYLVSTLKRTGTTIQIYYIAKYLDPKEFEVCVVTLSPEENGSMMEQFQALPLTVRSLNLSRIGGLIQGNRKLFKLVDSIKPDVIHTQGIRSDGYSVALSKNYPVVSTMQNYPFFDYPMLYGSLRGRLMACRQVSIIRQREHFIACSKSVSDLFKERNHLDLDYIQNGVDTEVFKPVTGPVKQVLRKKLNLPAEQKIFLTVGVLIPRKDMTTVIKAFRACRFTDALLIIAGEGFEDQQLKQLSGGDQHIIFTGNVSPVREYFQASDYFISASWAEGLPNTVLEAMACGLPVILSNIAPHSEVFETYKKYPYFFEIKNHAQLADLFKRIISEERQVLSEKMLDIIRNNFSAQIMSGRYREIYQKLIGSRD